MSGLPVSGSVRFLHLDSTIERYSDQPEGLPTVYAYKGQS